METKRKLFFTTGVFGVLAFVASTLVGGFVLEGYNPLAQYISEAYAIDTPYGWALRFFGFIPAGVALAIFGFTGAGLFSGSAAIRTGCIGFGVFYGLGTVVVGIFPCDQGCNKDFIDPTISQIIHNLMGFLTYVLVPPSLLAIGSGLSRSPETQPLSRLSFLFGFSASVFVLLLFSNRFDHLAGLLQRLAEGSILLWVLCCSIWSLKWPKPAVLEEEQTQSARPAH